MTITELLNKYDIRHEKVKAEKGITLLKIKDTNVLFWINDSNMFKMKRQWFEILEKDCKQYILFLYDKKEKKYYYLKFLDKNNWFSSSFYGCDKPELYLGKQVLNYSKSLNQIVADLKKYS